MKDEQGAALPYLDEIEVQIVPDQNAEALRLQSGDTDVSSGAIRADDIAAFRALADQGKVKIVKAGIDIAPDGLWFNLAKGAAPAKGRAWLQSDELRQAIFARRRSSGDLQPRLSRRRRADCRTDHAGPRRVGCPRRRRPGTESGRSASVAQEDWLERSQRRRARRRRRR
jgi:hypothetical protein